MLWIIFIVWVIFALVCVYFTESKENEFFGFLFLLSLPLMFYMPFILHTIQKGIKMKNYLFYDNASGEMFIVETDMKEKAIICARHYFEEPIFEGEISNFEAEMLGYDTY